MGKRIIVLALLLLAGGWYLTVTKTTQPEHKVAETGVAVGKLMPSVTLAGLDGKSITVGKSDKITILNFWATWCPPCREEMPALNQFYQNNQQSVVFYAVNIQEPVDKVNDFLIKNSYSLSVVSDKDGAIAKLFQVNAIPTTIVADKNGVIRYRKAGSVTQSELDGVIKGL